jgi:hypothetical protein
VEFPERHDVYRPPGDLGRHRHHLSSNRDLPTSACDDPHGPSWINYYKTRSGLGMAYEAAAQRFGGLGEDGLLYSVGILRGDGSWQYEDQHFRITLGPKAPGPAQVTIESRGWWNHFTGPVLEMLGLGEAPVSADR